VAAARNRLIDVERQGVAAPCGDARPGEVAEDVDLVRKAQPETPDDRFEQGRGGREGAGVRGVERLDERVDRRADVADRRRVGRVARFQRADSGLGKIENVAGPVLERAQRRDAARAAQDLVEDILVGVRIDAPELGRKRREDRELVVVDLQCDERFAARILLGEVDEAGAGPGRPVGRVVDGAKEQVFAQDRIDLRAVGADVVAAVRPLGLGPAIVMVVDPGRRIDSREIDVAVERVEIGLLDGRDRARDLVVDEPDAGDAAGRGRDRDAAGEAVERRLRRRKTEGVREICDLNERLALLDLAARRDDAVVEPLERAGRRRQPGLARVQAGGEIVDK